MFATRLRSAILIASIAAPSIVFAGGPATLPPLRADQNRVTLDLSIDGTPVAAPTLVVERGTKADVTVLDPDGKHGWKFGVVVEPVRHLRHGDVIPAAIELSEIDEGRTTPRAAPEIGVRAGQRADLDVAVGAGRKAHLAITID